MPPPSDVSGLIKTLEKIDAYLRNRSTKFLLSDRLTRADCYIIPVLQHLRVAGKVRGHPFMTSTRRGEGVRFRWTHVDGGGGSIPMWTSTQKIKIRVH